MPGASSTCQSGSGKGPRCYGSFRGIRSLGEVTAFSNWFPKAGLSLIRGIAPPLFGTHTVCQEIPVLEALFLWKIVVYLFMVYWLQGHGASFA